MALLVNFIGEWSWFVFFLTLAEMIAMGCITRAINKFKGRDGGFAWGFFLGGIGIIVTATRRRLIDDNYSKPAYYLRDDAAAPAKPAEAVQPAAPVKPAAAVQAGWKCTNCGKENAASSAFCTDCGERRHYNWKCAKCGKENALDIRFCPDCGNARSEEQEMIPPKPTPAENFLAYLGELPTAAKIAAAFEEKYGSSENEDVRAMIAMLQKATTAEHSYGNMKDYAFKRVEAFYQHGMRIYTVNRDNPTIACPVCGKIQRYDRESCLDCGALFRV